MFGTKSIIVVIDPLGNPSIEAKNFAGKGCEAATKAIEDALKSEGTKVDRTLKPEWAGTDTSAQQHVKQW